MEFKIKRDTFLDGIQKTLGIVEKKTTMPILNNVLLKTENNNKLKIIATDREISLISDYEAEIAEKGEITLSAKKLYEMVREIQGELIHFEKSNNVVKVSCQRAVYKIPGLPADDFPSISDDKDVKFYNISGIILKDLISKTAFAMATDEMRKNLNGVLLEAGLEGSQHIIKMVATDGHRLALAKGEVGEGIPEITKGVIVPRKGLLEVKKIIDENDNIGMGLHKNMLIVKTENTLLKVSLVDADYPDYKRVIPSEKGIDITLEKESFLHALRRMNVVSSERYSGVILSLSKGKMILNSTNLDVGEAMEEIDIVYDGDEVDVGFNVNYLIDAIAVITQDNIMFEVGMGLKPSVLKPADSDGFLCIVMPLKI